ncbi:MAG TPA: hypothetical protein VME18_05390 [Acidobacteriaceae bacterium]|nr:hypothetical protein [Acidobacteriaceae bacterium]
MPCLEMKVAFHRPPQPATRLRALLEKPGAAVLRRNNTAEAPGQGDAAIRGRLRVMAVLAVNLTNPPREPEPPAEAHEEADASEPGEAINEVPESQSESFAKGLEIWIADGARSVCVQADADEIAGALAMFDAYLRLARYQPAFQRLDQRVVGLSYLFREGLAVAIQGKTGEAAESADVSLGSTAAIPEIDDFRDSSFCVRFPNAAVGYFHESLRSASAWLDDNSYPNILGSK